MNKPSRDRADQLGPESAGQSGDTQGLPEEEDVDNESVAELAEEGQGLEADILSGVEEADRNPTRPVTTRQVRVDDVPPEYLDEN